MGCGCCSGLGARVGAVGGPGKEAERPVLQKDLSKEPKLLGGGIYNPEGTVVSPAPPAPAHIPAPAPAPVDNSLKCRNSHALKWGINPGYPSQMYKCDKCAMDGLCGERMCCVQCGYDLCYKCGPPPAGASNLLINIH